jgi:hypothetical protein
VVIRASAARDINQLLNDLRSTSALRREAALARLRLLGSRALARLEGLLRDSAEDSRAAALRVMDGMDEPRVIDLALRALDDGSAVVRTHAVLALRPWVTREAGTRVMEALVRRALTDDAATVREAAREALSLLPEDIVQPILEQPAPAADEPPADAVGIEAWLATHPHAPLSALHALITRLREGEVHAGDPLSTLQHVVARGAVHAELARRESAVALYDLRETFDAADAPLPLDYLTAMTAMGDASCIEPLAKAWAAAPAGERWWRDRLSDSAGTIAARAKLTKRHAVVKRVETKWPGFLTLRPAARSRRPKT